MNLLTEKEIDELVRNYPHVSDGRTIREIITDGDLPELRNLEGLKIEEGKVSTSVYSPELLDGNDEPIRLMYRSGTISTHDVVRGVIPFKDQVLATNHNLMRRLLSEVILNSQFDIPQLSPNSPVISARQLEMVPLEVVIRDYMAKSSTQTSLYHKWKEIQEGKTDDFMYAGRDLRDPVFVDLTPNGKLPFTWVTPSTKEKVDRTIGPEEAKYILAGYPNREVSCQDLDEALENYRILENLGLAAFDRARDYLAQRGIVLVDTKLEFGLYKNNIMGADEYITMDSSRWWLMDEDGELRLDAKGEPESFSKEFGRSLVPSDQVKTYKFSDEERTRIAVQYIKGLQHLTGEQFVPDLRSREQRIVEDTRTVLREIGF